MCVCVCVEGAEVAEGDESWTWKEGEKMSAAGHKFSSSTTGQWPKNVSKLKASSAHIFYVEKR